MLASVLGASAAGHSRLVRALLHLGLVLRDNNGNIVYCHFVRLRGTAVDIFETRRVSVLAPRFVQLALLLFAAAGCAAAAATFLLAWFQKWHILLLRNLDSAMYNVDYVSSERFRSSFSSE